MKKLLSTPLSALVLLALTGMMAACSAKEEPVGPNNNTPKEDPKVEVSGVSLNLTSASLTIDESIDLTATISPANASDKKVTWSTSDDSVATVSDGKVTGKKEGTATITATAGGKSAACTVTVVKGGFPEGKLPADNEIWYITSDNQPLKELRPQGTLTLQSNEYSGGMGVLKFSGPVTAFDLLSENSLECKRVTELLLPDCVEVFDTWAFYNKYSIKELRIPSSFRRIKGCFVSRSGTCLERFTGHHVSDDGRCVIIDGALLGFAPVGISSYEIPAGVVKVADGAFANAVDLKSVVIPSGVESLEDSCFADSGLESVTIPASVKAIHPYAFLECTKLKQLLGDSPFISDDRKFLYQKDDPLQPMTLFFFAGRDDTSYEIPEGIRTLQYYAFKDCDKLQSLTFPKSLSLIRSSNTFEGCVSLSALYGEHTTSDHKGFVNDAHILQFLIPGIDDDYVVPDDVTGIGEEVFTARPTLRSVTMGDQVTSIGNYAFTFCPALKSVTLSANLNSLGYNPFWYSDALESIYFRSVIPPVYNDYQYSEAPNLKVYVPAQAFRLYTQDSGWKDYWKKMVAYDYTDLPPLDFYMSSDYSREGEVTVYQKAKEGNGIDLVFMGDAYSDRQVASGLYLDDMKACAESFFTIEPYKSFRDLFNIYFVTTVSGTEGYERAGRSLGTVRGFGTFISGNDAKCFELARKAVGNDARMEEVLVIVVGNQDLSGIIYSSGTCHFHDPSDWTGRDYACGPAVTYFLKQDNTFERTAELLHHEAGGHGFAKLADEYYYPGSIQTYDAEYLAGMIPKRWFYNVDLTSDPTRIKWSAFLADDRYKDEVGIFEGGYTYQYGVWRPTETSIMDNNRGEFNAPSRYIIWYRIHKLAYGSGWNGSFEDFAAYDAINRHAPKASPSRARIAMPRDQRPAPPVVTGRTWRQARSGE